MLLPAWTAAFATGIAVAAACPTGWALAVLCQALLMSNRFLYVD